MRPTTPMPRRDDTELLRRVRQVIGRVVPIALLLGWSLLALFLYSRSPNLWWAVIWPAPIAIWVLAKRLGGTVRAGCLTTLLVLWLPMVLLSVAMSGEPCYGLPERSPQLRSCVAANQAEAMGAGLATAVVATAGIVLVGWVRAKFRERDRENADLDS